MVIYGGVVARRISELKGARLASIKRRLKIYKFIISKIMSII